MNNSKDIITIIEDAYLNLGVTFDKLDLEALEELRIFINDVLPTEEA